MAQLFESRKTMLKELLPKNSIVAEIGVFTGEFSQYIVDNLEPKKLYSIDPYISGIGVMGSGNVHGYNMEFFDLEILYKFVRNRFSQNSNVELCRETSGDFFARIPDGSLDAIYLDGDHAFETVAKELEIARFKVKEGGWIMGHDYAFNPAKGNPENKHFLSTVVDAFCKKHNLKIDALGNDGIVSFAIKNTHKYKFAVTSFSDREVLYSQTYPRMNDYCGLQNYEFKPINYISSKTNRHPSWNKILCLLKLLNENNTADYFVWIDDDIYLTNMKKSLSDFVDKYNFRTSNSVILIADEPICRISTRLNGGFIIIKNNPEAKSLLQNIWQFPEAVNPLSATNCGFEQEAFDFMYRFINRDAFTIAPQPCFQTTMHFGSPISWKKGDFSAHLQEGKLEEKLQVLYLLKKELGEIVE
jgi:hypothetical protein